MGLCEVRVILERQPEACLGVVQVVARQQLGARVVVALGGHGHGGQAARTARAEKDEGDARERGSPRDGQGGDEDAHGQLSARRGASCVGPERRTDC